MSEQPNPSPGSTTRIPFYKVLNGMKVPPFVSGECLEKLKNFQLHSDDVWIVSYPKSGTTWVQQIVKLVRNGGKEDERTISATIPYVESADLDPKLNLDEVPFPRAFKSHFAYDQMPCGLPNTTPCKYIYVARNPKDVVVSKFHFLTSYKEFPPVSWEYFFTCFTDGEIPYGSWFDHVLGWWRHRDDNNVLFVKYEDLKKDLPGAVKQIGKFLGYDLSQKVVDEIAVKTSFESMKTNPLTNYSWEASSMKPEGTPFMRKGQVGEWKNHLTVEQSAYFDAIYAEKMKDVALKFDFNELPSTSS